MNTNNPIVPSSSSASTSYTSSVSRFLNTIDSSIPSPFTSWTTVLILMSRLGTALAFSRVILSHWKWSNIWTMWTCLANLVRYIASSTALFPPPTTYTSKSLKKSASHVAQYEIPFPESSLIPGASNFLGVAPVAITTAFAVYSVPLHFTIFSFPVKSTSTTSSFLISAPKFFACSSILWVNLGPVGSSIDPG